jgi:hypothetical protein
MGVIGGWGERQDLADRAADAARKAESEFVIFTALSMLIGAFVASAAAAYGRSLRNAD